MSTSQNWRGDQQGGEMSLPRIAIIDHTAEGLLEIVMEGYNPTVINTAVAPDHVVIQGMTAGPAGMISSFQHRVQLPTPVVPESTKARFEKHTLRLIMQKQQTKSPRTNGSLTKKIRLSRVEEAESAARNQDPRQ